mmetsp:Transcript_3591/g.6634  ORF Transcript_3591/g.6634 Transcript_3591/m.6634 type:complete len:303 (-) Transcript_3591:244-1152(-)
MTPMTRLFISGIMLAAPRVASLKFCVSPHRRLAVLRTTGSSPAIGSLHKAVDDDSVTGSGGESGAPEGVVSLLPQALRLRGPVAAGYGRGSKKLGFPTANLPASLFGEALKGWESGVYAGYAFVEPDGDGDDGDGGDAQTGRGRVFKAVCNVGLSPTFEGQENPEKIVEAFLIRPAEEPSPSLSGPTVDDVHGTSPSYFSKDFYGATMRLVLAGWLRPEMKFPSFPALVAQITKDVSDADAALDFPPFTTLVRDSDTWFVGKALSDREKTVEAPTMTAAKKSASPEMNISAGAEWGLVTLTP